MLWLYLEKGPKSKESKLDDIMRWESDSTEKTGNREISAFLCMNTEEKPQEDTVSSGCLQACKGGLTRHLFWWQLGLELLDYKIVRK